MFSLLLLEWEAWEPLIMTTRAKLRLTRRIYKFANPKKVISAST